MEETELTVTRASDIEINLGAIELAAVRLVEAVRDGATCRWCAARALLREVHDYGEYRCVHTDAARGLVASTERYLADEPPLTTKCRACLGRRKLASEGEDGSGCRVHATCPAHTGAVH